MTFYDVTETLHLQNPTRTINGIIADGVTDDKTNLEKYIDYVHSLGGGTLVLPGNKTILISDGIRIYENMTLKSSFRRTIIKCRRANVTAFFYSWENSNYITIQGLEFDEYNRGHMQAIALVSGKHISIIDCIFSNNMTHLPISRPNIPNIQKPIKPPIRYLTFKEVTNVTVKNCVFKDSRGGGIYFSGRNEHLRIKDNYFNNLNGHAIHLQGAVTKGNYCSDVIIEGNHMVINKQNPSKRGIHGIYMTCADENFSHESSHHENVVVANNTIIGPGLSFANRGSADLFSLKDIIRLKCYGNTARNSGDLGYAIERCHYGVVSNNTADQNNSCGISIFGSSHISVIGNICTYNEKDHDENLGNAPYGGIRVEFDSSHVLITGNHFCGTGPNKRTQQYGIVVKSADVPIPVQHKPKRSPYNIKIGVNHYIENGLGDIYNEIASTTIEDISAKASNNIMT